MHHIAKNIKLVIFLLTICVKSKRYVPLSLLVPFHPPNITACVQLIPVRVKRDLGEGLVPVTNGEAHVSNYK